MDKRFPDNLHDLIDETNASVSRFELSHIEFAAEHLHHALEHVAKKLEGKTEADSLAFVMAVMMFYLGTIFGGIDDEEFSNTHLFCQQLLDVVKLEREQQKQRMQ
jgi:hypothetical protein